MQSVAHGTENSRSGTSERIAALNPSRARSVTGGRPRGV